jgi:hypothetical protein
MNKYALVKNGLVHSVFMSDQPMSAYPDILPYLIDITDQPDVDCNFSYDGKNFAPPAPPEVQDSSDDKIQNVITALISQGVLDADTANNILSQKPDDFASSIALEPAPAISPMPAQKIQ